MSEKASGRPRPNGETGPEKGSASEEDSMAMKQQRERAGNAAKITERRIAERFTAAFDVQVFMTTEDRRVDAEAWVRDLSANGMGMVCDEEFQSGDILTVRAPGRSLQCEVRHCRPEGAMFFIGLELLSSSDGTDIQVSLRDLGKMLHFAGRTREED